MVKRRAPAIKRFISRGRLEFLVDGIFAIAMTILVLEIRLPELSDSRSAGELGRALGHNGQVFFAYVVSFAVLGSFWLIHNRLYDHLERISPTAACLHIGLLAVVAFVPFCAGLLTRYGANRLAIQIYMGVCLAFNAGVFGLYGLAKMQGLFKPGVEDAQLKKLRNSYLWNFAALVVLLAFFSFSPAFD